MTRYNGDRGAVTGTRRAVLDPRRALQRTLMRVLACASTLIVVHVTTAVPFAWSAQPCGDMDASGGIAASDALILLKKAVGQNVTVSCACASLDALAAAPTTCGDLDASGAIAASDALLLLKKAVGQNVTVSCPACSTTTTTVDVTTTTGGNTTTTIGITTTTLGSPAGCGNGVVDGDEQCERLEGCADDQRCTTECTCEPAPDSPRSSEDLIEQALEHGDIDYPTSLLYRVWALFQAPELPEQYDGDGPAGEDTGLFFELSHARSSLPAEIESAIAPYLVRPNDPTSIYSQDPGAALALANEGTTPAPVGCALNEEGEPDWRYTASDHFVVWSCGGGSAIIDPYEAGRGTTSAIAEEIWTQFKEKFAVPAPDDFADGPAPQNRTDIYILELNQCRKRGESCKAISGNALAGASPASPCSAQGGGGPFASSAYILMSAARLPAGGDTTELRYLLTHEMFHAASFGVNLGAQGGICPDGTPKLLPREQRSWLSEASAEWSSFAFFPEDMQARRTEFFHAFQRGRDLATEGLQNVSREVLPYEAFLYPAFVQEESSQNPRPFFNFWLGSKGARNRADLDSRLNATFSFADHFRDFAVRNLNSDPPGDPIFPPHSAYDPALILNDAPFIPEPALRLAPNVEFEPGIQIAPLSAQYEHYYVGDEVDWVKFDLSNVPNSGHVRIDAIVKVDGTWERRKKDGLVFEFCREDDEDDIDEIYLVFSNDDYSQDGKVNGKYKLETRAACPGGWSGSIRWVRTVDTHREDVYPEGSRIVDQHIREDQSWSVTGSERVKPEGFPFEIEQLDVTWAAEHSHDATTVETDECGASVQTETGKASGEGTSQLWAFPTSPGVFAISRNDELLLNTYELTIDSELTPCTGAGDNSQTTVIYTEGLNEIIGTPLQLVEEDAEGSGHFADQYTIEHTEEPLPGGQEVSDLTIEWDLTRNPMP